MGQKQGNLANGETGANNPGNGENEVPSHVPKPPSENPSDVLTSTTPASAVNASAEDDHEDHSRGALEHDEQGHDSVDDREQLKASTTSKTDPHAKSETNETTMQTEQRQTSDPNGERRTPSECNNVCEDKNLETPLPPTTTCESFDSSLISISMDATNDCSSSMQVQDDYQIASKSDDDSGARSTAKQEHSSDGPRHHSFQSGELFGNFGSETQYPPTQVMERPADTASPSSYRIPSHVFARQPTGAEWSVASNESLFSIHMGNMSFSKDIYWLSKHDEMEKTGETSMPSPKPNMSSDVSSNQSPPPQMENRISQSPPPQINEPKPTEERAAETMREVIRENTESPKKGKHRPTLSHQSQGSTKSFAFPILTDIERNGSSVIFKAKQKTEVEAPPQSHEDIPKEQLKDTSDETKQSESSTTATSNGCFSYFSCCGFGQAQNN